MGPTRATVPQNTKFAFTFRICTQSPCMRSGPASCCLLYYHQEKLAELQVQCCLLLFGLEHVMSRARQCAGWAGQELPAALAAGSAAAQEPQHDSSRTVSQLGGWSNPAPLYAVACHLQGRALLQENVLLKVSLQEAHMCNLAV